MKTKTKGHDALPPLPPSRGLSRVQAATYLGIGVTCWIGSGLLPCASGGEGCMDASWPSTPGLASIGVEGGP